MTSNCVALFYFNALNSDNSKIGITLITIVFYQNVLKLYCSIIFEEAQRLVTSKANYRARVRVVFFCPHSIAVFPVWLQNKKGDIVISQHFQHVRVFEEAKRCKEEVNKL